ncbi:OmpH family outer membrane protein [Telmatospirillum siberiense]|nr:OmpH family outer membrane protein [Telmatospirillum siberiense]
MSRLFVCGGLVAALVGVSQSPAFAQAADGGAAAPAPATAPVAAAMPSPVIAIIDVDQILQESMAAKGVRGQADKYQQTFQNEMSKEEATLRSTQQDIDQQRKTLSQDAFAEKARAFDASVAEFQRKGLARRKAFDKSFNTAMGQVQQAMLEATQQIASRHGATVVLPRSQVVLFDDKMNITKEIIGAMDKKLPHVDFPAPKVEAESGPTGSGKKSQ